MLLLINLDTVLGNKMKYIILYFFLIQNLYATKVPNGTILKKFDKNIQHFQFKDHQGVISIKEMKSETIIELDSVKKYFNNLNPIYLGPNILRYSVNLNNALSENYVVQFNKKIYFINYINSNQDIFINDWVMNFYQLNNATL